MIGASAVQQLMSRFRGELIQPGDPRYDSARSVFNAAIDRRPALIARCSTVEDVTHAVTFAREQKLPLAVRGTGHNVAGFAVCDDGVVIDLSPMKRITVDVAARTVRAEGGCNWGEVNDALQPHGLAVTGGRKSHVRVKRGRGRDETRFEIRRRGVRPVAGRGPPRRFGRRHGRGG